AAVHAHVERLVALKAESASLRVELQRRDPEVGERPVDDGDAAAVEHLVDRSIVGVHELDPVAPWGQRRASDGERVEVAVEANQARRAGFEQRACMSAEADGTVDEQTAALGPQM